MWNSYPSLASLKKVRSRKVRFWFFWCEVPSARWCQHGMSLGFHSHSRSPQRLPVNSPWTNGRSFLMRGERDIGRSASLDFWSIVLSTDEVPSRGVGGQGPGGWGGLHSLVSWHLNLSLGRGRKGIRSVDSWNSESKKVLFFPLIIDRLSYKTPNRLLYAYVLIE